jgi:hypothetical protein
MALDSIILIFNIVIISSIKKTAINDNTFLVSLKIVLSLKCNAYNFVKENKLIQSNNKISADLRLGPRCSV